MPTQFGSLTEDELRNGWTPETLVAYLAERDRAAGLVPGNVVTPWKRPKPPMMVATGSSYRPHEWAAPTGRDAFNPHRWGQGRNPHKWGR